MIADELQELAALHALGMLRGDEAAVFEKRCAENPELAALVQSLRESADGLAFALPPVTPPAELRDRVLGDDSGAASRKVVPFRTPAKSAAWLKQAAAILACIVPAALAVYFGLTASNEEAAHALTRKRAEGLAGERDGLTADKAALTSSNTALARERNEARTLLDDVRTQLTAASAMAANLQSDLNLLKADHDKLMAEVAALKARGLYDQARIALMASTAKPAGKAVAVSLWDQNAQGGVLVVQNLPALPPNRNYQLWVLDGDQPVSAGLLTLDGKGGGRIEFKPRKPIAAPTTFAVTNETKGEKETPDLKMLVLAGQ